MKVNVDHEKFDIEGEENFPHKSGILASMLAILAERVEVEDGGKWAREYVNQLKEEGVLEDE